MKKYLKCKVLVHWFLSVNLINIILKVPGLQDRLTAFNTCVQVGQICTIVLNFLIEKWNKITGKGLYHFLELEKNGWQIFFLIITQY